jgi:hypothetical protein
MSLLKTKHSEFLCGNLNELNHVLHMDIKMVLKTVNAKLWMGPTGSGYGSMIGFCEQGN